MKGSKGIQSAIPNAVKLNRDAHVLNKTCPACGNLVVGFQKLIAIPKAAAEFTSCHFAIPQKGASVASIKGT